LVFGTSFLSAKVGLAAAGGYLKNTGVADAFTTAGYGTAFGDVDFQVLMNRRLTDDPTNANCVFIRGTASPPGSQGRWNSYYGFFYSRNGFLSVWKVVGGQDPAPLQSWVSSPLLNQGDSWNLVRVRAVGSSLEYYINGSLAWSGADTDLTTGQVGFGMYSSLNGAQNELLIDSAALAGEFDFQFDCGPGGLDGWQFYAGSWTNCMTYLPILMKGE
jgi:hypothetical protein